MKKINRWAERIRCSKMENQDMIIDATIQAHRYFSSIIFFTFLFYFLLISMTDYALWGTWNRQHLYDFVIIGAAAVNWFLFAKLKIARDKLPMIGNGFLLLLLILLAAGRSMGSGYVSYTLTVCAASATIVLCLNPIQYSLFALIAMCSEIFFNYRFLGGGLTTAIYYGVDAFLIFAVTSCLNFFFSLLRYQIFDKTSALKRENSLDGLTGLFNRKYFEHYFDFYHREDELSALICIDLDNFKTVNDTFGHQEGDHLLMRVSELLQSNFRKTDCIARMGGDEFMVFMPALPETQHAYETIQNLLKHFPLPISGENCTVPVSLSIGVVFSVENESCSYAQLAKRADAAMYQAKRSGKGRAVFFDAVNGDTTLL